MASFPCPYCAHVVATEAQDDRLERCPSCSGSLQIAYRYRIVAAHGSGSGQFYEAVDDIFGDKVAVLFADNLNDRPAVERFVEGNRLFAELGGGRGLVKLREVGNLHDRRPHVVHDWIADGTLEQHVSARGPVDQTMLLELIGDLLVGLGKAHRAMPTVVHGNIHPGTIGFLDKHRAVLFGFAWAQQVYEQDSRLADTFITQVEAKSSASRAKDLHQLGIAIHYAATGEWNASKPLEQQRARVSELGGPLPLFIDRMLTSGGEGYRSAVDALLDFDHLLEGTSTWKARHRPREQDRSSDLAASAWTSVNPIAPAHHDVHDDEHDEHDDEHADDDHANDEAPDFSEAIDEIFESERAAPSAPQFPSAAHVARRDLHAARASAAAHTAKPTPATASPAKVILGVVGSMFMFGLCVAGIADDETQSVSRGAPPPVMLPPEPIPAPMPYELPEEPAAIIGPANAFADVHHHTGTIIGPPEVAGLDVGERCDVWIAPNSGGLNCQWSIDCGEPRTRIYGGPGVGFSTCTFEDGRPTSASDEDQDAPDGSFLAAISGSDPMVLVEDRWQLPPTRVLIGLDADGGPFVGSVPEVPLAPRMSGEDIQAAIDRNELPEIFGEAQEPPKKLSPTQMRTILESRKDTLQACAPEHSGLLRLSVSLRSDGHVDEASISGSLDPDAGSCMIAVLTSTRFPTFAGPNIDFSWPIRF